MNHPTYKGRVKHMRGYVRIFIPGHPLAHADGYVMEHRLVVYEAGIDVPQGSHVHHINHDPSDNRLENLAVLSPHEHHAHHQAIGTPIKNQYGTFAVLTDEEKVAKKKEQMARWRAANKERIRAYKDARKLQGLPY